MLVKTKFQSIYVDFKVLTEIVVITINLEGSDPESGLSDNEANKRRRREEKGLLLLLEKTSLCFLSPPPTSILKIVTLWSNQVESTRTHWRVNKAHQKDAVYESFWLTFAHCTSIPQFPKTQCEEAPYTQKTSEAYLLILSLFFDHTTCHY